MRATAWLLAVMLGSSLVGAGARPVLAKPEAPPGTVEQLLDLGIRPFAIGHRGSGENDGADPTRPVENTVAAVRYAFQAGLSVVEVDAQLTHDHKVVLFHDDFLPDGTCINHLTLRELQARVPRVATLDAVLDETRAFNQPAGPLRGLLVVELKAASPRCDPDDRQDRAIVHAAVRDIRHARMASQVLFTSFSPAILFHAAAQASEIARILAVSGLQFLSIEEIQKLGPVTLIDKDPDLGLQWAEVGDLFRLPGYRSFAELLATAGVVAVRVVEADIALLNQGGVALVQGLHASGVKVFGFSADNAGQWLFLQSLGVDGIYTNDVAVGLTYQAPIP
jgi:glycerophosphoryl diester phosphodiesterase